MGRIKHVINLTNKEKALLHKVIEEPSTPTRYFKRAKILLASDLGNPERMTVEKIAKEYNITDRTVRNIRQNYLEFGVERAIQGKIRETPPVPPKVTDKVEAQIIHLLWSPPPVGKRRWTMRLLAQKAQENGIVESISKTRINVILKKYGLVTKF